MNVAKSNFKPIRLIQTTKVLQGAVSQTLIKPSPGLRSKLNRARQFLVLKKRKCVSIFYLWFIWLCYGGSYLRKAWNFGMYGKKCTKSDLSI
jgi:hypothetical protein